MAFELIESDGAPIKAWTRGVHVEDVAKQQLRNLAGLPFIHKHIAAMPDVHWGMGATVWNRGVGGSNPSALTNSAQFANEAATRVWRREGRGWRKPLTPCAPGWNTAK